MRFLRDRFPTLRRLQGTVMQTPPERKLVDDTTAAKILDRRPATIRKWRITGKGPRFIKFGQAVRYDLDDLYAFIESRKVISTAAAEKLPGAKEHMQPRGASRKAAELRCAKVAHGLEGAA
jgi:hypothetical protein